MRFIEFCCGLGGWSKGFNAIDPDIECFGVDIVNLDYPFNFIQKDLFDWEPNQYYDFIAVSVPCREFCLSLKLLPSNRDERIGLDLVWRAFHLIEIMKPKFWIMENVKGLAEFIDKPKDIVRYGKHKMSKAAYLWGNFPEIPLFEQFHHRHDDYGNSDPRRAEIPLPLAKAVARTMIDKLNSLI